MTRGRSEKQSSRTSIGGAADEAGGQYRRSLAALFVAHGLNGLPFEGLPTEGEQAIVEAVALETGFPVDDILVQLSASKLFLQAKRRLAFGRPLEEVLDQWLKAVRDREFDKSADFVGAAGADLSGPVGALASAITRQRHGALDFTTKESDALNKVRKLLTAKGATQGEIDLVLQRSVVLEAHVEQGSEEHAERGRLLLDGHVVAKGEGTRAWRELVSLAGDAARGRYGGPIDTWLSKLRDRQLPLIADVDASRAGYLERRHQCVLRYRERLQDRGFHVDLTALGAPIPPLPLEDMDMKLGVRSPESDERTDHELLWAFRRRGRALLTGLPGGGKSTAIGVTVAEWSRREWWALPIWVSLRRLAEQERFRKRPLHDQLVELAIEVMEPADRPLLQDALNEKLASGQVAIFLDGLDEAADRSLDLARDIGELLKHVHPDTDVLVATRDTAYADAQVLGFPDLRLGHPTESRNAVRAVLQAIANQRRLGNDADAWVEKRHDWVSKILSRDSHLSETPLMPVLLALLAGDSETELLPRTRSHVLKRVVEDVVRRRELKRDIRLGVIPGGHEAEVLLSAYTVIADTLSRNGGSAVRTQLVEDLVPTLVRDWGLAAGPAGITAKEILVFWDESGIFVATGSQATVAPRVRIFLEIGAALHASEQDPEAQEDWVRAAADKTEQNETLILAAGLSSHIAETLISVACAAADEVHDRLAHAAAEALSQGGSASDAVLRDLITRLAPLVENGDDESWKTFQAIARLPVPSDLQQSVLDGLGSLSKEHLTVGHALAGLSWGWPIERLGQFLAESLDIESMPSLKRRYPKTSKFASLADITVDQPLMRAKERAAELLLPGRPELAAKVATAMGRSSIATMMVLEKILRDLGYEELVTETIRKTRSLHLDPRTLEHFMSLREGPESMLKAVESLADPSPLQLSQQRRLEELASLFETLDLNNVSAWIPGKDATELWGRWVRLIATLGAFDFGILSSQARIVQHELAFDEADHAPFYSLFDEATGAPLKNWNGVKDEQNGRELALHLLRGPRGLAGVAAEALISHPEPTETARMILPMLDEVPPKSKRHAIWGYLHLVDDVQSAASELAQSDDHFIREAVAACLRLTDEGTPTALGRRLATDPEREVQLAALRQFEKIGASSYTTEMQQLLEEVASAPDGPFVCSHCGADNDASLTSCQSCHVVTEKPSSKAREILRHADK